MARKKAATATVDAPQIPLEELIKRLLERLDNQAASAEEVRMLRALEILERLGTPEARQLLQMLASGAPGASLTQEAAEALKRLTKKP